MIDTVPVFLQIIIVYMLVVSALVTIVALSNKCQGRNCTLLWAVAFAVVVFLSATYARIQIVPFNADEIRRAVLLTGDEPAYFMTASSLAHDGDLNLANNAADKDYLLFQNRPYTGSGFGFYNALSHNRLKEQEEQWGDARYMRHRPGTSVFLAPSFLLADHNQRFWSYTIISFCFALFCGYSVFYLHQIVSVPLAVSLVICLVCGLSPPVYFYLNQAYPEVPAGILLALIAILFLNPKRSRLSLVPFILAAMVIWFSDRALLATLIICAGGFFHLPTKKLKLAAVLILGSSGLLFAYYCWHRFGVPYPLSHNTIMGFSYEKIPVRLLQILFDGKYGWAWLFPPVLLLPAMFWQILKDRPMDIVPVSLILSLTLTLVLVAAFDDWAGGTCPRGRYYVIPQILFMVLLCIWLKKEDGRKHKMFWVIGLGSLGLMQIIWLASHPNWWFRAFQPIFAWKEIQPLFDYLPSLPDNADTRQWVKFFKMSPLLAIPSLSCLLFGQWEPRWFGKSGYKTKRE